MSSSKSSPGTGCNGSQKQSMSDEQQAKINEIRKAIGSLPHKLSLYCSNASILRYLMARNWNVKKATKMLKETLKWRLQYKPEEICWDEVASEAETGKIYRTHYFDKHGRSILVMRPGCQNTKSTKEQIRYLVYCMENAVLNLPADQQQMVWLIDFHGFNLGNISLKVTKETAHVLQEHYPERLGVAILYNPPKFFEPFWMISKPFLDPKTVNKVKFVYSNDKNTLKIMEDIFNMDELECAFGGCNQVKFNINDYAERMREDDRRIPLFWNSGNASVSSEPSKTSILCLDKTHSGSESESDKSKEENTDHLSLHKLTSNCLLEDGLMDIAANDNAAVDVKSMKVEEKLT